MGLDVLVVCSSGGHLMDAVSIARAWEGRSRAWVSFDKTDVRSLLAGERLYVAHGPTSRNVPNLLRNLRLARQIIGETRPRVLITTGAGVGVPFAWVAGVQGAHVVYVECAGRVDRPSLSGRLIAPVADELFVQWPELAQGWRRARYAGNTLLARRQGGSVPEGAGVLVTVGTGEVPFDRLLRAVSGLHLGERVLVQHGSSAVRPLGAQSVDYLPFDRLDALTRSTRAVVCHAGIGSVAVALAHGRRPIVVPRRRCFGEAVDDHQVSFARRLESAGLATVVENVDRLPETLAAQQPPPAGEVGPDLAAALGSVLDAALR